MTTELPDLWVLTVANGPRASEAEDLFLSLGTPRDRRVLVTNPPQEITHFPGHLLNYPHEGISIGDWWNLGLDFIAAQYGHNPDAIWDVVLAETDARQSPEDVDLLRKKMREFGATMAGADWEHTLEPHVDWYFRTDNFHAPVGRIPGIHRVVAGETGIRHDPQFRWWLADDDYEWQHRAHGGTLLLKGPTVAHEGTQGPLTGDRLQYWEEDQPRFFEKWGGMPATNGILK